MPYKLQAGQASTLGRRSRTRQTAPLYAASAHVTQVQVQQLPYILPRQHYPLSYADGATGHHVAQQLYSIPSLALCQGPSSALIVGCNPTHCYPPRATASHPQESSSIQDQQQPYFYAWADPGVDSGSWPLRQQVSQFISGPSIPLPRHVSTIPSVQSPCYAAEKLHELDSYHSSLSAKELHNSNVGSLVVGPDAHLQQHQQSRQSSVNTYAEGASMSVKIQSLPILDSLVSPTIIAVSVEGVLTMIGYSAYRHSRQILIATSTRSGAES